MVENLKELNESPMDKIKGNRLYIILSPRDKKFSIRVLYAIRQ